MKTKDLTIIALFSVLLAVCSWISVPGTVPFTLQTFGVFVTVGLLGGKRGTMAVLVYTLLGAIGIPVFAGFTGGVGILFGNTGGYIMGFVGSALVMWLVEYLFGSKSLPLAAGMVLGLLVCYAFGTAWFLLIYVNVTGPVSLSAVLGWCVVPFIVPDLLKIALAFGVTKKFKHRVP
jgi:Uncharacterized conserved protein